MEKYLYLSINILSILIPLLASFYPKAPFYKKWKYIWPSTLITATFFLIWDEIFTQMGIWGFNEQYLIGIKISHMPLEEILFFICIPYASVFTYFALNYLIEKDFLFPHQEIISSALIVGLLIAGMYHMDRWYTSVTFLGLAFFLTYQMLKVRPRYMGRFYFAFAVILIPFFITNGLLTGSWIHEEVVWYNDQENLGIRMGTIPLEDLFYGMFMILMNITIYEWLQERERWK